MNELIAINDLTRTYLDIFAKYKKTRNDIKIVAQNACDPDVLNYFIKGNCESSFSSSIVNQLFEEEGAVKTLNAEYWSYIMKLSGVLEFMPAKQKNEWNELIRKKETPDFEENIVTETIQKHLLSRESYLADKLDGVFEKLSTKHLTNSPFAFRERMIINNITRQTIRNYYTTNTDNCNYIDDLRSIISKLMGEENSRVTTDTIITELLRSEDNFGKWHEIDGNTLRLRYYKVGTVHLEVHPEIAIKLNRLLAVKYPHQINCDRNSKDFKEKKKINVAPLIRRTISHEVCSMICRLDFNKLKGHAFNAVEGTPQQLKEFKEVMTHLNGQFNHSSEAFVFFDYDPTQAFKHIVRTGNLPDKSSYQFYPTKEELADNMASILSRAVGQYDYYKLLEPSAGQGALLDAFSECRSRSGRVKENADCVEIDPLNCEVLKSKGYKVFNEDFLNFKPEGNKKYDAIIMNPPFNQGQAEAHVKHAFELLAEDGTLVACLPGSFKNKEIIKGADHNYGMIYEDQFDGTGVRVTILTLKK